jgi:pilus assembly protein CpaB
MAMIFLALSVVAAGLATLILFVVFQNLDNQISQRTEKRKQEQVNIVVAATTLTQGTTLTEDHLATKLVPRSFYLDTMVSTPETIVGRVPRERILEGEPVRMERLADARDGAGLNALIPKGQRALQVELQGASAVGGFVNPGDYVDILYTGVDPERGGVHTKTLLQSKLILAVDERLAVRDESAAARTGVAPSVTLALTPTEAQIVTHASRTGKVTLTLRNHVDVTRQEVHGVAPGDFIGASNKRVRIQDIAPKPDTSGAGKTVIPKPVITQNPDQVVIIEGANVKKVDNPDQVGESNK